MFYFEDVPLGGPVRLGSHTVSEAEIVAFAEVFDPLPMHVDPEAAAESAFDGIIASGFHTLCIANRITVDGLTRYIETVAGLGIDDLRWRAPVHPGDTLAVSAAVTDRRESESRPDRGILATETVVECDDEVVLSYVSRGLVERRPDDG